MGHATTHFSVLERAHLWQCLDARVDLYFYAVRISNQRLLGGFESLLLLAILQLDDRAYGVTIRCELIERADKDVAVGAIYTGLERLGKKSYVESRYGERTPERGGRAKRFYRVTALGLAALRDTQTAIQSLSKGLRLAVNHTHA